MSNARRLTCIPQYVRVYTFHVREPYLSPALGRRDPAHDHVDVASSGSVVRRERTGQHRRVLVCQRGLGEGKQGESSVLGTLTAPAASEQPVFVMWDAGLTSMDCEMCILFISTWGRPPPGISSKSSS